MGFGKWLMIHGPGSVGSVAKAMAKAYTAIKTQCPESTRDELLLMTLRTRYSEAQLNNATALEMVKNSQGRLFALTLQVIHMENSFAQKTMLNAPDIYMEMIKVVEEVTNKFAHEAILEENDTKNAAIANSKPANEKKNIFPKWFALQIQAILQEHDYKLLIDLSHKYEMHKQSFFQPENFLESDATFKIEMFALFLNSMGNQLFTNHCDLTDVEKCFIISSKLKPEGNPCHISLAVFYAETARIKKAQQEADIALKILNEFADQTEKDGFAIPYEVMPAETMNETKKILTAIKNGSYFKKQ